MGPLRALFVKIGILFQILKLAFGVLRMIVYGMVRVIVRRYMMILSVVVNLLLHFRVIIHWKLSGCVTGLILMELVNLGG